MADIQKARADALAKKDAARQNLEAAKEAAKNTIAAKKLPVPRYVDIPSQTGNAEADSAADLDAAQEGFRKRAKDEGKRFALATDTEYWSCICFQTREQKESFLAAIGVLRHGDKYLDGALVAKALGIALPDADVPYNTSSRRDTSWEEFVD